MKRLVTLLAALAALQTYAQRIEATLPSPDAKSLGMGGVMMTTLSGSHAIYNNSATAIFSHTPSQVSSSYYGQRSFDYYAVSGFCRFDNINLVQAGWRQFLREHGNNDMAVDLGYARRIGDRWAVGIVGRYMHLKRPDISADALAVDLSAAWQRPLENVGSYSTLRAGAKLGNLGGYLRDTEYTLPDYCADIQKILKCIVTPEVTAVSAAGDSLTIDGCTSMHVLYLDAKGGCVRGFDTKKEFTCSVRLRAQAENVTAEAEPFVQHMTCRAMNARRVDLHITLGLSVRAYAVRQLEIADCISDDRVETKCEEYDVTRAVGCVMHAFILEQNAELPNGKSPIETVLRCSVRYQIDTVQPQAGSAVVTGKACVEILYRTFSDTAMPERFSCILPFTQTVECAGAGEDCTIQISVLGGECTVQPREDSVGEYTVLNLYLKPTFCVQFTKSCTVRTVCDAYSIKGAWAAKYKNLSLERCEVLPPRSVRVKENVLVPENDLEQVLDIWCEGLTLTAFTEKENAAVRGKFTVCLLYRTKEKQIAYTERMLDFTDVHTAEIVGRRSVRGEITSVQYVITDSSTVECTAELRMEEQVRVVYAARSLESAELDETTEPEPCCAAVYYASSGEKVWDIAKRYHARVSAIRTHNDCMEDVLSEDRPMIICRK